MTFKKTQNWMFLILMTYLILKITVLLIPVLHSWLEWLCIVLALAEAVLFAYYCYFMKRRKSSRQ